MTHTSSPIERVALERVARFDRLEVLMRLQHNKGRLEHGQAIDDWGQPRLTALVESGCEFVDLLTYLGYVGDVPVEVYAHLNAVGAWLNQELQAHP